MTHARSPSRAITSVADLVAEGLAAPADAPALEEVGKAFRIRLSPAMRAATLAPGDPVARQFVPDARELTIRPEELADPIGDDTHLAAPGLTHRYPDRVILAVTKSCEVYCRFCFRRETVGETGPLSEPDLAQALAYIAKTPAIREVILTGGDPLSLSPRRIEAILTRLAAIPTVETVRIHSRVPVVAPDRIDAAMTKALTAHPCLWLVLHTNHAQELTDAARAALARLTAAGIPLLSQTVLLKDVNDSAETLADLFRALIRLKVKPYYLHHCDLAPGTSHFRTTIAEGQKIMAALRGCISGTCLPAYVLDIPGGFGKVPLTSDYLTEITPGRYLVRDPQGSHHDYADPA
ncbi:MAG TPA: lysine-2,3-aminomutase-like protein [Albidovulum sp.]|uniref:lysine-2,3-aminomutase-like protein n=1 Tax=Albidovulum sp. TaxID=1872424 RepID=UPI002BCEDB71|nr:lysine-2,3-aminomutase-like protein [Albidovulum sp.]